MSHTRRIALYPDEDQVEKLREAFEGTRLVYNRSLESMKIDYKTTGKTGQTTKYQNLIKDMRKMRELIWLRFINKHVLDNAVSVAHKEFKAFIKGLKPEPQFIPEDRTRQSIQIDSCRTELSPKKISIAMIGDIYRGDGYIAENENILKTFIVYDHGEYFVEFIIDEFELKNKPIKKNTWEYKYGMAIDFGVNTFISIVDSDNKIHNVPMLNSYSKIVEKENKIALLKVQYNTKGTTDEINKLNGEIVSIKRDIIDNIIDTVISREPDFIVINNYKEFSLLSIFIDNMEDVIELSRQNMWYYFTQSLKEKCNENHIDLYHSADLYSSITRCSYCGAKSPHTKFTDTEFECPNCNYKCNRVYNTLFNLIKNKKVTPMPLE